MPKPGDPNIVYANCKGRFGRYNFLTGQEKNYYVGGQNMYGRNPKDLNYRFQRVSPIEISPHDPNVVYHASQYLHRTTDEGVTWETISPDLTAFALLSQTHATLRSSNPHASQAIGLLPIQLKLWTGMDSNHRSPRDGRFTVCWI